MAKRRAEDAVYSETSIKLSRSLTNEEQGSNEDGSDSWLVDSGYSEPQEGNSESMDVDSSSSGANICSPYDQTEYFLSDIRADEDSNQDPMTLEESRTAQKNRPFAENVLFCTITIAPGAAKHRKKEKNRSRKDGLSETGEESPQDHILRCACALLNSGGGVLVIKIGDYKSLSCKEDGSSKSVFQCLDEFWKTIQPKLTALAKPSTYDSVFDRRILPQSDQVLLFISGPEHICTMEYNLYFPGDADTDEGSYQQICNLLLKSQASRRKPSKLNVDVSLKDLPEVPRVCGYKGKLGFHESKEVQLKKFDSKEIFKSHSQRERVCRHISAFANARGGLIFLGVADSGEVHGVNHEGNSKDEIEEKIISMINNMLFPVSPERKVHWNMEFIPVSGCETNSELVIAVIKVAGMESFGGVFMKCPKSYELKQGEIKAIDFNQWKKRVVSGGNERMPRERDWSGGEFSKGMEDVCAKFKKLRVSEGYLLTIKDDVQKIKDSFFSVKEEFPVTPEGFETNLPKEVQATVGRIQKFCSGGRNRGLIAASRSWLTNLGGKPIDGVICDLLVISRNLGGLHLITISADESEEILQYSKDVALKIKESLVKDGGCHEKFYVSYHVVPSSQDKIELTLRDHRYPPGYGLQTNRAKLNTVLKAMVIVLARVPSSLSNNMGVKIMNLLTKEQFHLLYQQININKELWIHGVAGSGKTLVAIEFMRELHSRGFTKEEILCVCENEGIAQLIRESNLCQTVCRKTFVKKGFPNVRHVVMDEVHNYEQPDPDEPWYQKAKQIVRQHDPDNPGYLWFFTDKNQTSHSFPTGMPPVNQQKPRFMLRTVIRNSESIFKHAKKRLGDTDVADTLVLGHDFKGEKVISVSYSSKEKSQVKVLSENVQELLKEGYIFKDIAVLFAKSACIPQHLSSKLNVPTSDAMRNRSSEVVVSTVHKYSGLERPVIILVDLECSIPYRRVMDNFLYCSETRGMVQLVIIRCQICRRVSEIRKKINS